MDLSDGIASGWVFEKTQGVLRWIRGPKGHRTRIDCALDDRKGLMSLAQSRDVIGAAQIVTRAEELEGRERSSLRQKCSAKGATLYIGSTQSKTRLRIYDKRLELQYKHRTDWEGYGIRWELEPRKERAHT
ncbi:MAG: replication initiation factor domain-containing protein [Nitrospirota bacterium]|nr:replication initiation factor domain-containing protein [Nitrospirota bacterium]MDE3036303.1 replication initiation factor domain-containing protein [Nitrospirota bacterium]MDE3225254.1 replication initiation factor domain-containing protein [Nitrospirota bacterium]MDE3242106.1 replication initiation factor domain-containing protein [Nitrospirota bacterium]